MSNPVLSVEEATTEGKKQTVVAGMMFVGFTLSVAILLSGLYFARGYYDTTPVSNYTRQTRCFVLSSAISPTVCKSDCNCKINDSDPSDWRFECETCSRKCFETSFKVMFDTEVKEGNFATINETFHAEKSALVEQKRKKIEHAFPCYYDTRDVLSVSFHPP